MKALKSHRSFDGTLTFWAHDSKSTGTEMNFSTFEPHGEVRGCLFWLSGLTCTDENFQAKAGAHRALAAAGMMVVCPDTSPRGLDLPHERDSYDFGAGAGFYVDATTSGYDRHYRMRTYVADELYELVLSKWPSNRGRVAITGHSMGGHGALTLGLREPEKFVSISAFSPIAHPSAVPWGQKAFTGYLGDDREKWKQYDATELVLAGARHPREILIEQGGADAYLTEQLRAPDLEAACRKVGQPLLMRLREGYDHSYWFISTFIESHVEFHAAGLG